MDEWRSKFDEACHRFAGNGERVLGFADLSLDPETELRQDDNVDGEEKHFFPQV
jgi:hypothetical protein